MCPSPPPKKYAIIIGAGPAGLTAAYELLTRSDIIPIIIERDSQVGGISKTVNYRGNRIDIGGHRFFSKSAQIVTWWEKFFPVQGQVASSPDNPLNSPFNCTGGPDPEIQDRVFLVRKRISRIYFLKQFFAYPLRPTFELFHSLGWGRTLRILRDYLTSRANPITPVLSLEDFFINRFGKHLYQTFFKEYTEKLWGVPCNQIKPEWGAQRIKGLSLRKVFLHSLRRQTDDALQAKTETSLIERFHYPKFGPGQLWEAVAEEILKLGGTIHLNHSISKIQIESNNVTHVAALDKQGNQLDFPEPDHVITSMPLKDLFHCAIGNIPDEVRNSATSLEYRDFLTVGLLCQTNDMQIKNPLERVDPPDNWLYIQEPNVKMGRVQIFNNWSPFMVADPTKLWLGLEYFATEGDSLWSLSDEELIKLGTKEIEDIGVVNRLQIEDATVIRQTKAYPSYAGGYENIEMIRAFLNSISNIYPVGRNGAHRYNNQDHSMLSSMAAVDSILNPSIPKSNIWRVNAEQEYHEMTRAAIQSNEDN
ncbi:protoporphyrinogen oxidase [Haloferula luteola]|uniref:Protoporphyrinogen oxidase n=1 Tax=Haloferula luteola TaxID=595692 RepID=A0A840V0D6_9BACT|nr:NAD(P)/FAD-dependent oxidoreductase [Haloferula luteola]MBB5351455.1 protoporphyrinogen oxidase [Haloferula luteola]